MDLLPRYVGLFLISTIQMFSAGIYAFMNAVPKNVNEYFDNISDAKSSYDSFYRLGEIPMFILAFMLAGKLSPFVMLLSCSTLITVAELIFRYAVIDSRNKYIWFTVSVFQGGAFAVIKTLMKLCIAALFPQKEREFKKKLAFYLSFMILIPNILYILVCKHVKQKVEEDKVPVFDLYKKIYWYVWFGPLISLIILVIGLYCRKIDERKKTKKYIRIDKEQEESTQDNKPFRTLLYKAFQDCKKLWVLILIGALSENINILLVGRKSEFIKILDIPKGRDVYLIDRYLLLLSPLITFLLQKKTWLIDFLFKIQTILLSLGSILFMISAGGNINNVGFHVFLNIIFASSNLLFKNTFPAVFLFACPGDTSKIAFFIQMCFRSVVLQILLIAQSVTFKDKSNRLKEFTIYYIYIVILTLINLVMCVGIYWVRQKKKASTHEEIKNVEKG
eukprot:GAHX01000755.1.p1 GENE.GAHX01000755.1~~GAHX01000755.1.p1  ORF type:complete len:447 (+),score=47.94 GAHX01000755.1:71-1411(+)